MAARANARHRAASAAGFVPARDLSPEGKTFTATHPSLYLHVYCNFSGVQVHAYVDWLDGRGYLRRIEVAQATFKPPQVSERLVVEWGQRALTSWLERNLPVPD